MSEQFTCDSGAACESEPTFECLCAVCKGSNADERHHICDAHFYEGTEAHLSRVKLGARWYPLTAAQWFEQ